MSISSVLILGAGAWGTALASLAAPNVNFVYLWSQNKKIIKFIAEQRENSFYLPTIKLAENILPTEHLQGLNSNQAIILAVPSHAVRAICQKLSGLSLDEEIPIIICSKGMEANTGLMMSEVIRSLLRNPIAVLSGPNFAKEVALGLPGGASLACQDSKIAENLHRILSRKNFIININQDIIGTQVAGIIKNITAIACGASINLGQNARAFIITLGFREMNILCQALGGKTETLKESCGIGDLILTCTSKISRNMSLGLELSKGQKPAKDAKMPEGYYAAEALYKLLQKLGIHLPLCEAVYHLIFCSGTEEEAILDLFADQTHMTS